MRQITPIVKHLLIINIIVFLGTNLLGSNDFFERLLSLYFPYNPNFKLWQVLTHMFMHGGFMHLLFNMLALWMFGTSVEQAIGSKRFVFLYFSAGLGAVLLQLGIDYFQYTSIFESLQSLGMSVNSIETSSNPEIKAMLNELWSISNTQMVGASGCIMGVLVAFGMLNPNAELMMIFLPIPIKAKYFIPLLVGYDIISGFIGGVPVFGMNIAHWAHVGGALIGLIIMYFWKNNQFDKYRWN